MKQYMWCNIHEDQSTGGPLADEQFYLASEVDAHLATLAKDAARYRWLRDKNAYIPEEQGVTGGKWLDELCDEHLTSKAG